MTIVVPFDGTALSQAALQRATDLSDALDEDLHVVTIIPNENERYARERDWLDQGEAFDPETVVSRISSQVSDVAPEASFEYEVVGRYAQAGSIAREIREQARAAGAELVVIGSDNAGNIVTSVSSVGSTVATDDSYDVLIVRQHADSEPRQDT